MYKNRCFLIAYVCEALKCGHHSPESLPGRLHNRKTSKQEYLLWGEEDGGGVGGGGVPLSPRIRQDYSFRHRRACRTPAESRQECLAIGKEYIQPCKTQDQALNLWSGITDSKTLQYQRTNPR